MSNAALSVVELLLTAHVYNENRSLDENDLPPRYRRVFYKDGEVKRPISVTNTTARAATSTDHPWDAISGLLFSERDEFSGSISLAEIDMAEEWYAERADDERVRSNPVMAYAYGEDGPFESDAFEAVVYETAREANRPIQADRVWIDSLLDEYFDSDDEDEEEMLDLVDIRAPEEIDMTLDDLVLTTEQEEEIEKVVKAIEHRDYLAKIGLREIGKLLFVGPPGTGKTSTARGLAHSLDLPFVEVKLSMITSQYLGETAKNVEKTFEVAKRLSPCILFMDEFDFVAKTRGGDEHAAIKRAVNTLLKSIDDMSLIDDDVLLIGATNHPNDLDSAAWRRFDEIVSFPKPDRGMRSDILRLITYAMDIDEFDPDAIADITEGLTGSDLRLVMREAVLSALTEERTTLTQQDLVDAVDEFEERDNLKNLDMMDGDADALIAGGVEEATDGGREDHEDDHDHDHDHDD
jgi:ATP-dependent 26S proteasome regulatory subunit